MAVTAATVKELRERTGAGMMECKRALDATAGDIERAIEELRKSGGAKADKKAGRITAEGIVVVRTSADGHKALMLEVNSETDFVARDENFLQFVSSVADTALAAGSEDMAALARLPLVGQSITVEEARLALIGKVGENIHLRRAAFVSANTPIGVYLHGRRIGVLVMLDGDHPDLAKDLAMHIAASKPLVISPDEVSADLIEKEKEIYLAQAAGSGKPQDIIEKMVQGRLKKFLAEVSLVGQPFVKDPDVVISDLLSKHRVKALSFSRFEVGEGIEKETENFVDAVMSQVQGK